MNWIQHPVILEGERVKLIPLESAHFEELVTLAKNPAIWEFMSIKYNDPEKCLANLKSAVLMRAAGEQYPFTVFDKMANKIIGNTRLHSIFPEHKKLEIGHTWYDPAYWRTGYNRECKLLLLTYSFETLKTVRVQLQTDENNMRSRTAIAGIGAQFEGVMRKERIRDDGSNRNTAIFSIIDDEWEGVKEKLKAGLNR